MLDETAHRFRAEGLRARPGAAGDSTDPTDPTEFLEVRAFAFNEVVRMVERSEIVDAMTIVAVLHVARRR